VVRDFRYVARPLCRTDTPGAGASSGVHIDFARSKPGRDDPRCWTCLPSVAGPGPLPDWGPPAFLPRSGPTRAFSNAPDLFLVANPPGLSVAEAILRYRGNANVLSAEPDYVVQVIHTPTDPLWNQQWDMVKIAAPAAWDTQTNSSDVIVAVIDTGIDYTHPDLQANLWVNPADNSRLSYAAGPSLRSGPRREPGKIFQNMSCKSRPPFLAYTALRNSSGLGTRNRKDSWRCWFPDFPAIGSIQP